MKSTGTSGVDNKGSAVPPAPEDAANPDDLMQRLKEWREVAMFLRRNVVQGRLDESGNYSESCRSDPPLSLEELRDS
jgi:hypothetical protein